MELDCDLYRIRFEYIKGLFESKPPEDRLKSIGLVSLATYVPIIIVAHYFGELYGFTSELNDFIDLCKNFYIVKSVKNVRKPI